MFRNRWIRIPLLIAVWFIGSQLILGLLGPSPVDLWRIIFTGFFLGLFLEGYAWFRVRSKYGEVGPMALEPRQKRFLMLMQNKANALETCKAAVESLFNLKHCRVDADLSRITMRSKVNWSTWGSHFTIDLHEAGAHLTAVTIETKPLLPTILIDGGEAWKTIDQIVSEIKKLDSQPSKEALNDGAEMLQDLTVRPIKARQ